MNGRFRTPLLGLATFLLFACSGGGGDSNPPTSQPQPLRTSFPAEVFPVGPPPFTCEAPGVGTLAVMNKLNAFWQSGVQACACDAFALASGCAGNAFVSAKGYIYYDRAMMNRMDVVANSTLPADAVMAHEFGHNVQLALGLNHPGKIKELQADCLSGYYTGFQVNQGQVNQTDLMSTFNSTCGFGDPLFANWWEPGAHGTCPERVSALQQGINGYFGRLLPGQSCP
jgi:hypothetical protein